MRQIATNDLQQLLDSQENSVFTPKQMIVGRFSKAVWRAGFRQSSAFYCTR
jgi:hypothetical protein